MEYLDWLYCKNPDGPAIGFDAWDGNRLAAHYVCVPATASVAGKEIRAMLSLNTATHPEYQGKGLFTKLARLTYDTGADAGMDCVFGVANANSTSGFVRKLGFQLVQPLEARIGIGSLGIDWAVVGRNVKFERRWTSASLAWRCANPKNPIIARIAGNHVQFHTAAKRVFLSAYAELTLQKAPGITNDADHIFSPFRLFVGLLPTGTCSFRNYVSIPQRLRPSPLNFIYRSLVNQPATLEQGSVYFSFLDFDAY